MIKDFNIIDWDGNDIVLFGAGADGKRIGLSLQKYNVDKFYFCDSKKMGECLLEKDIISEEELRNRENINIVIATGDYCEEIYKSLAKMHFNKKKIFTAKKLHWSSGNFDLSNYQIEIEKFFAKINKGYYIQNMNVVITEKCTLRCRDCSTLMPYFENPVDIDEHQLFTSFDNMLKGNIYFGTISVIGGEPLVNQILLNKFLKKYQDSQQIGWFNIVTNGTIVPSNECIKTMQECKNLRVVFSNYGKLSHSLNRGIKILEDAGIRCVNKKDSAWKEYGVVKSYKFTDEECQKMYDVCLDRIGACYMLLKGNFYSCARAAQAINVGLIPQDIKECVNVNEDFDDSIGEKIINLVHQKKYLKACKFCNVMNGKAVPVAVQVKRDRK